MGLLCAGIGDACAVFATSQKVEVNMPEELESGSTVAGGEPVNQSQDDKGQGVNPRPKRPRRRRRKPQYYGAIDLGTNNCRLLIARSMPDGFKVVDSYSKVVRLGAGLSSTGLLSDKSMDMAVEAIGVCAAKMKRKNVTRWRCIATQACRAAGNGDEFLSRVKKETGLTFETISPRVEARLSVMGVLNIIDKSKDIALVIDIGGGSTELSWVDVRKLRAGDGSARLHRPPIAAWVSLPIGVVNLSEMYPEDHDNQADWYAEMKAHVLDEIKKQDRDKQFTNTFKEGRGHMVGTSGTVTSLASVLMELPFYQRDKIDGIWVDGPAIMNTAKKLAEMSYVDRQLVPCIGDDRASMITAGCAILEVVSELWPSQKIRVADRGLREGLLMGQMNKSQISHHKKGVNHVKK